ncbi:hypothetical protein QMO56_07400 [Roseomonas sp. E05]|uniref:hypothetical protein n=1 Tax=Roseomonas sp. E05 TaxID=3046310 RepID=UPI0024B9F490|nr:hypothetical protein [Roseomonas sp. E05]MDJ0387936.1 hypothetical protein [Roseomonas sp. E05]
MTPLARFGLPVLLLSGLLAGCSPSYSPDTYASRAVQQANKVEQGVVVGRRAIEIAADGTTGMASGAAAGGVAGSRIGGGDITSAFGGIGGGLIGGLLGAAAEKGAGAQQGYEYIVRKPSGELVSVVQRDDTPLALGQKVLVIAGAQARIVPDYTVPNENPPGPAPTAAAPAAPPGAAPAPLPQPSAAPPLPLQEEALPPPAGSEAPTEAPTEAAPASPASSGPSPQSVVPGLAI